MRITYIHQYFKTPSEPGGTRSYEFASRLARDGHDVSVICGGTNACSYEVNGFRVTQIPILYDNKMSSRQRMAAMAAFMLRSIFQAIRHPADVVLATSTPLTVAVPGILASWACRARFVFEVRDLWPSVPYELGILRDGPVYHAARLLERFTYNRADHVLALSPGMAEGVRRVNKEVPITIVPNASDHDSFATTPDRAVQIRRELGWDPADRVAVYAGSFGPTYDVLRWLNIAAHAQTWRLVLIGDGALTESAHKHAQKLGLDVDRVLLGSKAKNEVARYLAASDLCLSSLDPHPALAVNSLNKVFDALAAGRPVAFTHDGWLPELLTSCNAGWRLPKDPAQAAQFLDSLTGEDIATAAEQANQLGRSRFQREDLYHDFRSAVLP